MDDLIVFWKARLDEWESFAKQALPHETGSRDEGQPPGWVSWRRGPGNAEFGLRQVEASRRIIAEYEGARRITGDDDEYVSGLRYAIRSLCAIFGHLSDYRPEWKP